MSRIFVEASHFLLSLYTRPHTKRKRYAASLNTLRMFAGSR